MQAYSPALALAVISLTTAMTAPPAPAAEKQTQSEIRRRYAAIEQGWKQRKPTVIAAVWTDDYLETWPDAEPEPGREPKPTTREEALKGLRTNLGNRTGAWTRTHQILGVKLLPEGEEAEVWVRTRTRGTLKGENWKLSLSQGWTLDRNGHSTTVRQATTEFHTWVKTPAGWRLRSIAVKKTQ